MSRFFTLFFGSGMPVGFFAFGLPRSAMFMVSATAEVGSVVTGIMIGAVSTGFS